MLRVLVRGVGDVGSAVAHRLFGAGYTVVIHDGPTPTTSRRLNAFTDAVFDGEAQLAGVTAVLLRELDDVPRLLARRRCIPVSTGDLAALVGRLSPDVLVDARMRKRAQPEVQRGVASLTVGLGPNCIAGETVDVAVETSWENLGALVTSGPTLPLAGEPRAILGHARDRFVYAPVAGLFRTEHALRDVVRRGEIVAHIEGAVLTAPLDGALRGLTHDAVAVAVGTR